MSAGVVFTVEEDFEIEVGMYHGKREGISGEN